MAKISDIHCKGCRPKKVSNRYISKNLTCLYISKFESKGLSYSQKRSEEVKNSDSVFHISRYRINKGAALPVKLQTRVQFFAIYWDQFNDFEAFSSFIVKSSQISPSYFLINSHEIQKKSKYQFFIQSKEEQIPIIIPSIHHTLPTPHSRPMQLLTQQSFWNELIALYFQYLHPRIPLFSIHSFNPETASKTLLSAIYYGGLYCRLDKPPEIINYFEQYAKQNIKEIVKITSLTNTQAIFIYSALMVFGGKLTLSRALLAHAVRMSYSLGLHLNLKSLPPIQQYNRLMLFSNIRALTLNLTGMSSLALGQLTEFGQLNSGMLIPQWQIPNSSCVFYFDSEDENIIYGFCCDTYSRFHDDCSLSIWTIGSCTINNIDATFDKIFADINQKYFQCIQTFDLLLKEFPHHRSVVLSHKYQLIILYHNVNLERYKILKMRASSLKPKQISNVIKETSSMFDSVVESESFIQHTHIFPYTAGLNFIGIYSSCNESQKLTVRDRLHEVIKYLSKHFCADKLAYLIIKNEYESILKDR